MRRYTRWVMKLLPKFSHFGDSPKKRDPFSLKANKTHCRRSSSEGNDTKARAGMKNIKINIPFMIEKIKLFT